MKLLFLSPCVPDPNGTGWEQRAFLFLKAYSQDFDIVLICCNFSGQRPTSELIDSLNLLCGKVLIFESNNVVLKSSLLKKWLRCFSLKPFFASASFDHTFLKILLKSAQEASLIHVSRLELFSLVPAKYYYQKTILDLDECHFTAINRREKYHFPAKFRGKFEQIIRRLDNFRVYYYQAKAVRKAHLTFVCSEVEKIRIEGFKSSLKSIFVVPNVVKSLATIPMIRNKSPKRLLFVGNLSAPSNIDAVIFFAQEIFFKIIDREPDCEFHIVGRQPSPEIVALTKYDKIKLTIDLPNIEEAYLNATVAVVPIRFGAGTKLKLLEAFGFGIPCISTSLGCEGLSVRNNEHLLIADTPGEFFNSCIELLGNLDLQRNITNSAWQYMRQFHTPESIAEMILGIIAKKMRLNPFSQKSFRN